MFYYAIHMPIKNIYIKGNHIISDDEIIQLSNIDEYPSFLLTKASQIKKDLKKKLYIDEVKITKKFGNVIEIEIYEYQVIAVDSNGDVILENGVVLENTYELTDVPILVQNIENEEIQS